MKKSVTFTPSQVVNLVLVLFSVVSPAVVKALADAGYQFDPTLMATYGAAVAVIVGGCRAYLSSNSGTQSGVPSGPDRKAQAAAPPSPGVSADGWSVSRPVSSQAVHYGAPPAPVAQSGTLSAPDPAAPVSVAPRAAQGFSDVAAEDDGHDLIAGEEMP